MQSYCKSLKDIIKDSQKREQRRIKNIIKSKIPDIQKSQSITEESLTH